MELLSRCYLLANARPLSGVFRSPPFYLLRKKGAEQTAVAYMPPCGVRHSQANAEAPTTLAG